MTAHALIKTIRQPDLTGRGPVHEGTPNICYLNSDYVQILSRQLGISSLIGSYWEKLIIYTKTMTENVFTPDDPYAEGTPLTVVFGDQPKVLILASLLSEADRGIKLDDLSRLTGLSRDTLEEPLDELHNEELVIEERDDDARLYQINVEHPATRHMAKLEEALLDHWYEAEEGLY